MVLVYDMECCRNCEHYAMSHAHFYHYYEDNNDLRFHKCASAGYGPNGIFNCICNNFQSKDNLKYLEMKYENTIGKLK